MGRAVRLDRDRGHGGCPADRGHGLDVDRQSSQRRRTAARAGHRVPLIHGSCSRPATSRCCGIGSPASRIAPSSRTCRNARNGYNTRPLGDMSVNAQRDLSRAAKVFAFQYALDRTLAGGSIVPFADAAARAGTRRSGSGAAAQPVPAQSSGRARADRRLGPRHQHRGGDHQLRHRLRHDAGHRLRLRRRSSDRSSTCWRRSPSELYLNFVDPTTAGNFTTLHQNNHRSQVGRGHGDRRRSCWPTTSPEAARLVRLRRARRSTTCCATCW